MDPLADTLTRIRNAILARHSVVVIPHSKAKLQLLQILGKNNFLAEVTEIKTTKFPTIEVKLIPERKLALKKISKPGLRVYHSVQQIKPVLSGLGIGIYSTSAGLMTDKEAKKAKKGGELICEVY